MTNQLAHVYTLGQSLGYDNLARADSTSGTFQNLIAHYSHVKKVHTVVTLARFC